MSESKTPEAFGGMMDKVTDFLSPDERLDKTRDALMGIKGELETGESYLDKAIEGFKIDLNEVGIQDEAQLDHIEAFKTKWQELSLENQTHEALVSNEHARIEEFLKLENFPVVSQAISASASEQDFMDNISNKLIGFFPSLADFDIKGTLMGIFGIKAGEGMWSAIFGSKEGKSKDKKSEKKEIGTEISTPEAMAAKEKDEEVLKNNTEAYLAEIEELSPKPNLLVLGRFETLFEERDTHDKEAQGKAVIQYLKKQSSQFEEEGLSQIIPATIESGGHWLPVTLVFKDGNEEVKYKLIESDGIFNISREGQMGVVFDGSIEDFLNKMDTLIDKPGA